MSKEVKVEEETHELSFFERYLTLWVLICMGVGTGLGFLFPGLDSALDSIKYAQVSLPIAVALFFMIYPIMVQIDFRKVIQAGKTPKPVGITLFVNWAVKPFTMAFFAWLFMKVIFKPFISPALADQYVAGMILLGIAPCTAMVLVWSYLARGNMGHTLVMVAINSLTMLFLYAPLGKFLLGVADIIVPFATIAMTVGVYVGVPLVAGYISRKELIRRKGEEWFEDVFLKYTDKVSMMALLFTLVILFVLQGEVILNKPVHVLMIALPLVVQIFVIFFLGYGLSKLGKLAYEDAAPTSMIGASNHFEVAIATATMLFGLSSGAALATVVGVLIEVPIMLTLVRICWSTRSYFSRTPRKAPETFTQ